MGSIVAPTGDSSHTGSVATPIPDSADDSSSAASLGSASPGSASSNTPGHNRTDPGPPRVEEIAEDIYAYIQPDGSWWINNSGFMVGDRAGTGGGQEIVLIDTCSTEARTRRLLDHISAISDGTIRTVINTHHHGDHTHGNYLTYPATVIGHTLCRELVTASGLPHFPGIWTEPDWGDLRLAPPNVTFDTTMTLWIGDTRAELHCPPGPAHTTNDVVVYLPDQRILFSGDLVFNGGTPFVLMGSVSGSLASLDWIRRFDAEIIVPGHGPITDPGIFDQMARYFHFLTEVATDSLTSGQSALEYAQHLDLGEFATLLDAERIVGNLHRARYELQGNPPGGPMDIVSAIIDMVTYNGGQPLTCLA